MYNLDISTAMAAAAASNNSATPRTPEIVNSLIAMTTNPLDFNYGSAGGGGGSDHHHHHQQQKRAAAGMYVNCPNSSDSNSSTSSVESRTHHQHHHRQSHHHFQPSVQQTCSQLIKAGLKLSIEQKRKLHSDNEDLLDLDKVKRIKRNESESEEDKHHNGTDLTPEDEERRRRRRERNKIAATKCRLKKRERTANLINEAEVLDAQNVEMKTQYAALKKDRQHLEEVLRLHKATCRKEFRTNNNATTRDSPPAAYNRLPPVQTIETTTNNHHSYSRPAPPPPPTLDDYEHSQQQQHQQQLDFDTAMYNSLQAYRTTPSIIVESINDDDQYHSLTDLDNPGDASAYGYNAYAQNQNYGHGIDGCLA